MIHRSQLVDFRRHQGFCRHLYSSFALLNKEFHDFQVAVNNHCSGVPTHQLPFGSRGHGPIHCDSTYSFVRYDPIRSTIDGYSLWHVQCNQRSLGGSSTHISWH